MADLRRLFWRLVTLATPLAILLCIYVWTDPFEVLRPGALFYGPGHMVPINRDYVSTETYLRHPRRRFLDSFIFGSSRSNAFRAREWAAYIHSSDVFHYDASGESLFGIWSKVRFLHRDGRRFRNALIILDATTLPVVTDLPTHLLEKDPRVAGTSRTVFHSRFVLAFLSPPFFTSYLWYRATGAVAPWVNFYQEGPREVDVDPGTNDFVPIGLEREVARRGEGYFVELARKAPRDLSRMIAPSPPCIASRQDQMLREIAAILRADGAHVIIVISPAYDRVPLNPADVAELRRIFGDEVYDFSGANRLTNDIHNYFEPGHFRAPAARAILRIVYDRRP